MKRRFSESSVIILTILLTCLLHPAVVAQTPSSPPKTPVLEIYYFHPSERCPIDQSIEETTRKLMQTDFTNQIKAGTLKFRVLNTDDKANAGIVAKFEMNAQALYLVYRVKGKEIKKDLTEFAFSTCQTNAPKFRAELRQEILHILSE